MYLRGEVQLVQQIEGTGAAVLRGGGGQLQLVQAALCGGGRQQQLSPAAQLVQGRQGGAALQRGVFAAQALCCMFIRFSAEP